MDIVALAARHDRDTVELRAQFRDLTKWGDRMLSFNLETDGRAFEIEVTRRGKHAPLAGDVLVRPKKSAESSECGYSVEILSFRRCDDLSVAGAPDRDVVTVVVPRRCLGAPRWIRAGVSNQRASRKLSSWDLWAPRGTDDEAITGPFGPRVRRG